MAEVMQGEEDRVHGIFREFLEYTEDHDEKLELLRFARGVRDALVAIEELGPEDIGPHVEKVREALAARGQGINCHVKPGLRDMGRRMTAPETVEWYAGQLLDIVEKKAWGAMNTYLNMKDWFVPEWVCEQPCGDAKIEALIRWLAVNAHRESRFLTPNPQAFVLLEPLLDQIRDGWGLTPETIDRILVQAQADKEALKQENDRPVG